MNLKDIGKRINDELLALTYNKYEIKVNKQSEPELLSWLGGSQIALSPFINNDFIKKQKYLDNGRTITYE